MSSSNSVLITAIEEATYGVTPATGDFKTARYVSESLSGTPQTAKSTEIHADRTSSGQVQVGLDVGGDINEELAADELQQDFIRAAMMKKEANPATTITGQAIVIKSIDKTLQFEGSIDLAKGDLIFLSGFTDAKNQGMAYVSGIEATTITPEVPAVYKPNITATPTTDTDLAFTFAIGGGSAGVWNYGDNPDTPTSNADGAFTYPAAGTYAVTFTNDADSVVTNLSLTVVGTFASETVQVSENEEITPAVPAVEGFLVTIGKETIADETSETTAEIKKASKLSVGQDIVSFSICKDFTDLTDKSIDYLGMLVNQMKINMQHGSIAEVTFGFMGNGYDNSPDTVMTAGRTIISASTVQPFNSTSDISGVFIDGKIADFCLQSLNLELTNGLSPQVCLGRLAPRTYALGTASVSVSGSAYIADSNWNLLEKKLTQQPVSIAFAAENLDGGIAVMVHGAQLSFVDPAASGMDQQVSIDFSGSATNTENGYFDIYFW